MKTDVRAWAWGVVLAVAGLGACGGGTKPAEPLGKPAGSVATTAPTADPDPSPESEPPASPELLKGIKAFESGDLAAAQAGFEEAIKKNPADFVAHYNLGLTHQRAGHVEQAEASFKAALKVRPKLERAISALVALYAEVDRADDAIKLAREGLAAFPKSADLHANLAVSLAAKDQREEATKEFEEAAKLAPNNAMVHLTFAHWLVTWKLPGAVPHLDQARSLVKDDLGMIASIGHEYRLAGAFKECVETFDRAVALKDGGEVRTERALCHQGAKNDAAAMDDLKAAVQKEPSYAPGHYYLGGRLAATGKFKEAVSEFEQYLKLAPSGGLAEAAKKKLEMAKAAASGKKPR